MNAEFLGKAPADAVAKLAAERARRRNAEANDALDFMFLGDDEGRHAAKCVHAQVGAVACTRTYDTRPVPEAEPADHRLYEGTGIGALYGLGAESESSFVRRDGDERHVVVMRRSLVAELAGWNLTAEGSL